MAIEVGLSAGLVHTVTEADTAVAAGSGDVPVLATPRLLALAEAATVAALAQVPLPAGQTSVGTRCQVEHLRPTHVGETLAVAATLVHVDGRLLRFEVAATDDEDHLVGTVVVTRVVVDRDRFLRRTAD